MCNKCKKSGCSCPSSEGQEIAALKNQIQELTGLVNAVSESTRVYREGHPILCIQQAGDIAKFNFSTGLGSGAWENWALCTGTQQFSPTDNALLTTPNFLDRFLVAAGDNYSVNDIGGSSSVTLTVPQLPAHDHTITDGGHTHDITDPGHNHGGSSGAHTHTITTTPHTHTVNTESSHTHGLNSVFSVDENGGTGPFRTAVGWEGGGTNYGGDNTLAGTAHTHTVENANVAGTASSESVGVTISNAFVGITETELHTTGITVNDTGDGEAHENRPPYYAVIFVIKL